MRPGDSVAKECEPLKGGERADSKAPSLFVGERMPGVYQVISMIRYYLWSI